MSPLARAVDLIANRMTAPGFAADHCAANLPLAAFPMIEGHALFATSSISVAGGQWHPIFERIKSLFGARNQHFKRMQRDLLYK